jgi:hypothetical protein
VTRTGAAARPLSAEDLLAGADAKFAVEVPADVLPPAEGVIGGTVTIRPVVLSDVALIHRAAREDDQLASVLLVSRGLVEPAMAVDQVLRLPAGLVDHLAREIARVSGLTTTADELAVTVRDPVVRACFVLGRAFGWTPDECAALTVGQVLLYLEQLGVDAATWRPAGAVA